MTVRTVVFDAYGTLYDVQSVGRLATELCGDKGELITQLWRLKQLEYTWLRGLMQTYEDFSVVARDSLDFVLERVGVRSSATIRDALLTKYLKLDLYPETLRALKALSGYRLAILSNGSQAMLDSLVEASGVHSLFSPSDQRRPGEDLQARSKMLRSRRKIARGGCRRSALRLFEWFRRRWRQALRLSCRVGRAWWGRSAAVELGYRAD
jgi:2-haloalkanoic acid dehalogenase type II